MRIGLPAGLQGAIFSISNVLIQSSINSFGSVAMAGNTAAGNLEGFVYTSMNAVYQTNLSFTSQNMGAGNWKRMKKILGICLVFVSVVGLVMGRGFVFFGHQLLGIYSSDPEVIQYGINRMQVICGTYLLCGIMDVLVGSMRGMGYSFVPMIVSLVGAGGSLRPADSLDLYRISVAQISVCPVLILSHYVDSDSTGPYCVLV